MLLRRSLLLSGVVLSVLLCSSLAVSVDAASIWSQTYGGAGYDAACSVIATSDGGYAIAGNTNSFGAGSDDFWLVKTDALGNTEWNKTYGGTANDMVHSLIVVSDGGYAIAGYTTSFGAGGYDFWLVKTDEFGVVPEYSSWFVPALVLTATVFIIINKKKLLHRRSFSSG